MIHTAQKGLVSSWRSQYINPGTRLRSVQWSWPCPSALLPTVDHDAQSSSWTCRCFLRKRTGKSPVGSALPGLQRKTAAICGLRRNFFPRLSGGGYQILSLQVFPPCWPSGTRDVGRESREQYIVDPSYYARRPISRGYICITWLSIGKRSIASYFCHGQQCYREGASASRRPDAYFDQIQAMAKGLVTIKGQWFLCLMTDL